jgi:hypothetical protein
MPGTSIERALKATFMLPSARLWMVCSALAMAACSPSEATSSKDAASCGSLPCADAGAPHDGAVVNPAEDASQSHDSGVSLAAAIATPDSGVAANSEDASASLDSGGVALDAATPGLDASAALVDAGLSPDASLCPAGTLSCAGACAPCPAQATATACAGAVCEASACATGFRTCAGLCADGASGCTCAPGARPPPAAWSAWPPVPVSPPTTAYAFTNDVVVDAQTCLMWQREVPAAALAWDDAAQYCDTLVLAGYDDWRLPTETELQTILDRSLPTPTINATAFPNTPADQASSWYWSSTVHVRDASYYWIVDFFMGLTAPCGAGYQNYVRCVR